MKVLIIGCGAIGSYYGAKLQQAGAEVVAVIRTKFDQVQTHGIKIKSINEELIFTPKVINQIEDYQETADYILVATKVLPEVDLVEMLKPVLKPKTAITLIQNGIHIEKNLVKSFPNNLIIRCLAFICVSKPAPYFVDHQDFGRIVIGKFPQGAEEKVNQIAKFWQNSGIECKISNNINQEIWKKLVWNAPFNPISVLSCGATTKELLNNRYSRQLIVNVMQDVIKLANSDGCNLDQNLIKQMISYTESMTPYKTSMLLDFENNRSLEIEAILGNAVRFAQNKQINTPFLNAIYGLLSHY